MPYLIDTSVLVRLSNVADFQFGIAMRAIMKLHRQREVLHLTAQNLIELRNVATRPTNVNGLGLSVAATEANSAGFEAIFPVIPETPDIFPTWKSLVAQVQVIGKRVHDARLVAVCRCAGISHLLTFNVTHFQGLCGSQGPIVVDPANV